MAAATALSWHSEQAKERQKEAGRFEGKNEDGSPKVKVQVRANLPQAENNTQWGEFA